MNRIILIILVLFPFVLAEEHKPTSFFGAWKRNSGYIDFTAGQRWATFGINAIVPGAGSVAVMRDWTGAAVQWVLVGGFFVSYFAAAASISMEADCYGDYCNNNTTAKPTDFSKNAALTALCFYGSYVIWNIVRSATYVKAGSVTSADSKYGGLGLAVLPGERGDFRAHLLWNRAF